MFKRIFLFLGLNILIVASISILCDLIGLRPYITRVGLDFEALAIFCIVWGMTGSFISLLLSKKIAKWMLSIKILNPSHTTPAHERNLCMMVQDIAIKAHLTEVPEVGIFSSSACNAFATGFSKKSSLIAVSSKLLETLSEDELEAVIAHEMTHIRNGDMVTMSLLQGVINAFVMFLSRVFAYGISSAMNKDNKKNGGHSLSYFLFTMLFELVFISLGSVLLCYFSRKREFFADAGGAHLTSKKKMISALKALDRSIAIDKNEFEKQKSFAAMMIRSSKPKTLGKLFSTHPSIEERIEHLESLADGLWNAPSSAF
jgi:heat shock protein HtpX